MNHDWKKIGNTAANVSVWVCDNCKREQVQVYGRLPLGGCNPKLNLYFLFRAHDDSYPYYDTFDGHVVRARSVGEAREMCPYGDEGPIWRDSQKTSCEVLADGVDGKVTVILSSYNAG